MSKSLKNYPDPNLVIDTYGADATRFVSIAEPPHLGLRLFTHYTGCFS